MALSDSYIKTDFLPNDELEHRRAEQLLDEMGLADRDINKLRNQMLSADEAVIAKQEELTAIRQHRGRKPEWQEFLDVKARMGHVLHAHDFIAKLKMILPQLRCADGRVFGTIALFTPVLRTYDDGFHPGWSYIGWVHNLWNPEYTIDYCDEDGVPRGRRNGWRNILLNSIIATDGTGEWTLKGNGVVQDGTGKPLKIITEEKALEAFGYPTNGATASLYRMQLWEFRNGKRRNKTFSF